MDIIHICIHIHIHLVSVIAQSPLRSRSARSVIARSVAIAIGDRAIGCFSGPEKQPACFVGMRGEL